MSMLSLGLSSQARTQVRKTLKLPDNIFARWNMQSSEVTVVDGKISQVTDIAGGNYHMIQETVDKQPLFNTDINGRKYLGLRPSTTVQALKATLTLAQPFTIIVVFKQLTVVNGHALFSTNDGNTQQGITYRTTVISANLPDASLNMQTGTGFRAAPSSVKKTEELLILGYNVNGASSKQLTNGKVMPILTPGVGGLTNPSIGYSGTSTTHTGNYDVYDVIIYDRSLSDQEMIQAYNSLNQTYPAYKMTENYGFGDSIGAGGTGSVRSFMSPNSVPVSDVLFNYCVPGARLQTATYKGVIDQYNEVKHILDKTRKIFIQVGMNDITAGTLNAQWNTDYRGLVADMIADGFTPANIFLTTPPYYSTRVAILATIKGYLDQMATDFGVISVDMIAPMLAGGGDTLLSDTVHPNAAGVAVMANVLQAVL